MSNTQKTPTEYDFQQVIKRSFNDEGATITIDGFLAGKVGRKITQTISTTSFVGDTLIFDYIEDGKSLYQLTLIFTDSNRTDLLSAERTA